MDNSAIEKIGTAQLDIIFAKTGIADPHIKRDEKTMSWDGHVSIFKAVPFSKETHFGDIPVQVKTHFVHKYYSHIPVDIADLKIYKKEKRVLYLVIEMLGDDFKIYYKALFLWDLEKILSKVNSQDSLRLPFDEMPYNDSQKVKKILLDFVQEANKQQVTIPNVLSLPDLGARIKKGELKFDMDLPLHFTENDILKGIKEQKPYIYFHDKELNLSFPVDRFSEHIELIVKKEEAGAIGVNGKVYFDSLKIIKTTKQTKFNLGKSISGTLYPNGMKYHLELKGNLEERISTLEFILALSNGAPIEINGKQIELSISQNLTDKKEKIINELKFHKDIKKLLKKSHIAKKLDLDNLTKSEVRDLEYLCRSELYDEGVPIGNEKARIGFAKISNISFLCYSSPLGNGLYHVCNFFRNDVLHFALGGIENKIAVSNYLILCGLDTNAIAHVDNLNYKKLVKELKKDNISDIEHHYYWKLLLQLLVVYDNTKREDTIKAVIELFEFLYKLDKSDLLFLNLMQSYKRIRQLNSNEIKRLIEIRDKAENDEIKCGCCILLGAEDEFKYHFKKLNKEQRQSFIKLPIINLLPSKLN